MDINTIKSIINSADEAVIINDDGEKVDSFRSKASERAAKLKEMKKELGLYDKYEAENERNLDKIKAEIAADECTGASFSTMIGGAQTAAPISVSNVTTVKDIKEYLNGKRSK